MPVQWAGLAPPLLVDVRRDAGLPLRAQLEGGLRDAIRSGRLAGRRAAAVLPRARPPARALPRPRAGVLRPAAGRGLPRQRVGSAHARGGGFQRPRRPRTAATPATPTPRPPDRDRGSTSPPACPTSSAFPREDWAGRCARPVARAAWRTSTTATRAATRGCARCWRATCAGCARRSPTATTSWCAPGSPRASALVLRALARAGYDRSRSRTPATATRRERVAAARRCGSAASCSTCPSTSTASDVDALAATGAQVVVVTPAHQSPTGVVLAAERRHALVAWARDTRRRRHRGRLRRRVPLRPRAGRRRCRASRPTGCRDRHGEQVAGAALRLGWIALPARARRGAGRRRSTSPTAARPALDQLALALLIESGRFDRHLRRMRARYARRRDRAGRRARPARPRGAAHRPGRRVPRRRPPAGRGRRARASSPRRPGAAVGLYGMSGFRVDGATTPPQLVLGFGNLGDRAMAEGIATVADLLTP